MLYVFAGLPASGKSTLARRLAGQLKAVYLRIDTVEQALRESGTTGGPEGYVIAYRVAADNLALGLGVVADCVNALTITRDAWHDVAARAAVPCVDIEVVCSDPAEHRARLEARTTLAAGPPALTWDDVRSRVHDRWPAPPVRIDTAGEDAATSFARLRRALADARP